jgi:RNA polymerase sigma-70 factor, ECF subfamily
LRDFDLAEDALQEACLLAARHWSQRGLPERPRAWLITTARNKAIDELRRRKSFSQKEQLIEQAWAQEGADEMADQDDRLRLIFLCCHPALGEEAQIALTLRALGGLSTEEIANAFLVSEKTMAQRLVRAKRKISGANIPYKMPLHGVFAARIQTVRTILYLIFNEGYEASSGSNLVRASLCYEAIRLTKVLMELAPPEAETLGLLALMLLHDSRREARLDRDDHLVPLEHQDRRRWRKDQIELGDKVLKQALNMGDLGSYQLQAAISGVHARAESFEKTDWTEIELLYERLHQINPTPVVRLNWIYVLSRTGQLEDALALLKDLAKDALLQDYQPLGLVFADILERMGRKSEAAPFLRKALKLTDNKAEHAFLERKLEALLKGPSYNTK